MKKVQSLVVAFSKLDRWPKKKRGSSFLEREAEFLSDVDELFDVFCDNTAQDYSFYHDQKGPRVAKCLDVLLSLTSSDKQFIRRLEIKSNLSSSSACRSGMEIESAADYVSSLNQHAHTLRVMYC